jgi:hypothetical protein
MVRQNLVDLHPDRRPDLSPTGLPPSNYPMIHLSLDDVKHQICRPRRKSSPGITKLRYDHLRQCFSTGQHPDEQLFLQLLHWFVDCIVNARLPPSYMEFLGSSILIALPKPNSSGVRPIAMGDVFRKVASASLQRHFQSQIDFLMADIQLGIGARAGSDKIIHTARCWHDSESGSTLLVDFKNAFNNVSRDKAIATFSNHLPALVPYVSAIYNRQPRLWFLHQPTASQNAEPQVDSLLSREGSQQGDPLGPLVFAMAILPFLQRLKSITSGGLVRAYIDDITVMAQPLQLFSAMQFIDTVGPSFGLFPNYLKYKIVLSPAASVTVNPTTFYRAFPALPASAIVRYDASTPASYGFTLLGSPIGSHAYIQSFLSSFLDGFRESHLRPLSMVATFHSLWCFFHYIIQSIPTFLFRTVPPVFMDNFRTEFESIQLAIVSHVLSLESTPSFRLPTTATLLSGPLSDRVQRQLRLPLSHGGFNLRYLQDTIHCAFLGSVLSASHHLDACVPLWTHQPFFQTVQSSFDYWSSRNPTLAPDCPIPPPSPSFQQWLQIFRLRNLHRQSGIQHLLSAPLVHLRCANFTHRLSEAPTYYQLTYRSLDQPITGVFLQTWPKQTWSLSNNEFSVLARIRLGLPAITHLVQSDPHCICRNRPKIDRNATHILLCTAAGHHSRRHDTVVRFLCDYAKSVGISVSTKYKDMEAQVPNEIRRVDFVFFSPRLTPDHSNRHVAFDPTIFNPHSTSVSIKSFLRSPSTFFTKHSVEKINKYKVFEDQFNYKFIPLPINAYGNISPEMISLLHQLASKFSERSGTPLSIALFNLRASYITTFYRILLASIFDLIRQALLHDPTVSPIASSTYTPTDTLSPPGVVSTILGLSLS